MDAALYIGDVVHKRVRPREHRLRYRVFSLLVDVDRLDETGDRLRLFSHNRANLVSLHDRDHGDGTPLAGYLARIAARAGLAGEVSRFRMLCYPRILGYAFNPLTVYFGTDDDDRLRLMVYEVNNTFGERQTYVLPVEAATEDGATVAQSCDKRLYVSPFNDVSGRYDFHVAPPADEVTVGVALRNDEGPILRAHFRGARRPLTDRALVAALAETGWMTVRVIVGIHVEAAKLWLKGLRPRRRPRPPEQPVTILPQAKESAR